MAGTRKPIDWPGIEADYFQTDTPIRELAKWYRTDESGIRARAKRYGWTRPAKVGAPAKQSVAITQKSVEQAATVLTDVLSRPPASSASDLVVEAYATLRDVMANSPFPAPRVSAARVVFDLATIEGAAKGLGGKKGERAAAAEKVASGGRFAAPQPPKLVVSNP